jgi:hypothetical protein
MSADISLVEWLANGERGISSNAIVTCIGGVNAMQGFGLAHSHPRDPDDLRRCRLLLEQVPNLGKNFHAMSTLSHEWGRLVSHWQEICDLMDEEAPDWRTGHRGRAPRTYRLMQHLYAQKVTA